MSHVAVRRMDDLTYDTLPLVPCLLIGTLQPLAAAQISQYSPETELFILKECCLEFSQQHFSSITAVLPLLPERNVLCHNNFDLELLC